jgi:tetratricopeptide (TPR) repeat protein
MFALLTVVKGALPQNDLMEICDLSVFDLEDLPQAIRRWFLHSEAGWQFQHPRLADGFRRALDGDAEQMEQRLLEYCARWCTHMSRYALRYYAAHLAKRAIKDTDSAKQLYALMEDEAFLQAQREAFPDEPELPLSLLQGAIEAASARDEPVPLANALLLHAQRAQGFRRQSPYRIWRETGNLRYALKVADLYHPRVRTLWYLLLAEAQPDLEQGEVVLESLSEIAVSVTERYYEDVASTFFRLLVQKGQKIDERLRLVLSDKGWASIIDSCVEKGDYEVAHQLINHLALTPTQHQLMKLNLSRGLYNDALQIAQQIEDFAERSEALVVIAETRAKAGLLENAQRTFQQALHIAQRIERDWQRSEALATIAQAQAQVGLLEDVQHTLQQALQTAQRIERDWQRSEELAAIAQAQAQAKQFEEAVRTAEQISVSDIDYSPLPPISLLPSVIQRMIEAGDRHHFKQLLPSAAYSLSSALRACAALMRAYPDHAQGISEVVMRTIRPSA